MDVACTVCGATFQAQRVTARYCGSTCRTRASRAGSSSRPRPAGGGQVTPLPTPVAPAGPPETFDEPSLDGAYQTTRAALERASRLHTPLGQAAVRLAYRLDNSHKDTGSAVAALARQLQATFAAATADVKNAASPLDRARDDLELRRRRRGA